MAISNNLKVIELESTKASTLNRLVKEYLKKEEDYKSLKNDLDDIKQVIKKLLNIDDNEVNESCIYTTPITSVLLKYTKEYYKLDTSILKEEYFDIYEECKTKKVNATCALQDFKIKS